MLFCFIDLGEQILTCRRPQVAEKSSLELLAFTMSQLPSSLCFVQINRDWPMTVEIVTHQNNTLIFFFVALTIHTTGLSPRYRLWPESLAQDSCVIRDARVFPRTNREQYKSCVSSRQQTVQYNLSVSFCDEAWIIKDCNRHVWYHLQKKEKGVVQIVNITVFRWFTHEVQL